MKEYKVAKGVAEDKIKTPTPSALYHWIRKQKNLCLKKITSMDKERIRASTKEVLNPFFDLYEKNYEKYKYRRELIVY
jgi:hypothetical protein